MGQDTMGLSSVIGSNESGADYSNEWLMYAAIAGGAAIILVSFLYYKWAQSRKLALVSNFLSTSEHVAVDAHDDEHHVGDEHGNEQKGGRIEMHHVNHQGGDGQFNVIIDAEELFVN